MAVDAGLRDVWKGRNSGDEHIHSKRHDALLAVESQRENRCRLFYILLDILRCDTFLALNENDGTIAGFSSDDSGSIDRSDSNMDASKSEAILLGSLTTVWIEGVKYYEIRLDLNENNKECEAAKSQISMEQFKIYTSTDGAIEDLTTLEAQNLVYDLDADEDNTLVLSEESTGSGTDDYAIYLPVSQFQGLDPATTPQSPLDGFALSKSWMKIAKRCWSRNFLKLRS